MAEAAILYRNVRPLVLSTLVSLQGYDIYYPTAFSSGYRLSVVHLDYSMVPRPEAQLWPYVGLVMKKTEYSKGGRKLSLIEPKSGLLTWQGDGCGLRMRV